MAFEPFPRDQYVRVADTDTPFNGGGITVPEIIDLQYLRIRIYIKGTLGGSEQIRIKLYDDPAHSGGPIATSAWADIAEIDTVGNWIGDIYIEFDPPIPLNPDLEYFTRVELQNYTRNGDTFYIGCCLDADDLLYEQTTADLAGIRMAVVGMK